MAIDIKRRMATAAWAFRGYNITNLGRSPELLAHAAYGPIVGESLKEASRIAAEALGRKVDLVARVRRRRETTLKTFGEATALVAGVEVAQIRLLKEFFGIEYQSARTSFGYSLGEVTATICDGLLTMEGALSVPISLADDAAELGRGTRMGVVFSRGEALDLDEIRAACNRINLEGKGVIGISSYLSPNSLLVLGQGDSVRRLKKLIHEEGRRKPHVRLNPYHWPPLHTPIMWERNISCRAGVMMHTIQGGFRAPRPPILSLVTGKASYNEYNGREILHRWIDHPQRVWDVVYETLCMGVETVIHVGPHPNLFPATFKRLSDNVRVQLAGKGAGGFGLRLVAGMVRRPWLTRLMPERTALMRAPFLEHVILEDWLLEQKV